MLLFLDFDGVLHTKGNVKFEHLPRLEAVLRDNPEAFVVLTTSWRCARQFPFETLRGLFAEDLQERVLGSTPEIAEGDGSSGLFLRNEEIAAFLEKNDGMAQGGHVILDDDASLFPKGRTGLILCDPSIGFGAREEESLRLALSGALDERSECPKADGAPARRGGRL